MKFKSASDQLRKSLYWGLGGFVFVMLVGTLGYRLIEGWSWVECLYMTIITVSTVGFEEVHALSPQGRLFTALLILFGVGLVAYFLSRMIEFLFQRSLGNVLGRRIMIKKIDRMKNHTIICGYGRTGCRVASELELAGHPFVIVEKDRELIELLTSQGIPHVVGDATEEEVLEAANLSKATALVATLDSDAENLFLTMGAIGIRPDLRIIARVHDPASVRKFQKAGASRVISPVASGASQIAQLITRPAIVDLIELVAKNHNIALQVFEHPVDEDPHLVGKTLAESRVRQLLGGMVIAVKHSEGETSFDPGPDTQLEAGDVLVAIRQIEDSGE
jgi:voltage-gated potassium channel